MSFLYPGFLWALFALAVPIIIHIINLRSYVTVYFSNVDFLTDIEKEAKSKVLLKKWLLLLIRLLALAAMIIAFAVPVKRVGGLVSSTINQKYIFCLDNSMSLTANRNAVRLLDFAKNNANQLASSLNRSSQFYFITHQNTSFSPELTKDQLLSEIKKLETAPKSGMISDLLNRAQLIVQQDTTSQYQIFLFSDYQQSNTDFQEFKMARNAFVNIVNLEPDKINNVAIDCVWTDNPNHLFMQSEILHIQLRNYSQQLMENLQINLFINDSSRAYTVVSVNANSSKKVSFPYKNTDKGIVKGHISIKDNGFQFDNKAYFSYLVKPKISVKVLAEKEQDWLLRFYGDTTYFRSSFYTTFSEMKAKSEISDLLVINELQYFGFEEQEYLLEHLRTGNSVIFIPSMQNHLTTRYNSILNELGASSITAFDTSTKNIAYIDFENPLFNSALEKQHNYIQLPFAKKKFGFSAPQVNERYLLRFTDKTVALSEIKYKGGIFYFFSFSLSSENSDFINHPIIVPILFNAGFLSNSAHAISYRIDDGINIKTPVLYESSYQENIILRHAESGEFFIPGISSSFDNRLAISFYNQLKDVGNYYVTSKNQDIFCLSFNYHPRESDNIFLSNQKIEEQLALNSLDNYGIFASELEKLGENGANELIEKNFWHYFVILTILLLMLEMVLARYWTRNQKL
jgi:hypothetical protein